jgi:uncharacterized protein YecE (DUF72 family)
MIRLGTSGFSYDDWVGPFYPADLPRSQWLTFYAHEFDTVELNVTYYRPPSQRTVAGWMDRTPDGFLFSVKAHSSLTHERLNPDFPGFRAGLSPLIDGGRLACVLAQFPFSFHPTPANREYLRGLRDGLADVPVVVEFRDSAWVGEETFTQLASLQLGFCSVDEPQIKGLMPPIARATGPLGYVRFHGRNAKDWWEHEHGWQRYDYTYSEAELREWVPKLRQLDADLPLTLVYANNHYRGQSVDALRTLRGILAEQD